MTSPYITEGSLQIEQGLYLLVEQKIAPGTGIDPKNFWHELGDIVTDLSAKNRVLLEKRQRLQASIDRWYRERSSQNISISELQAFLQEIGYLMPEAEDFSVITENVDKEIATMAGPQLVVPVDNARYALNAANARWGSLYDALYGSDVIPEEGGAEKAGAYNPVRGDKVMTWGESFLDDAAPLAGAKHADVQSYRLRENNGRKELVATLNGGAQHDLAEPEKFVGYRTKEGILVSILLINNGLHIEIQIDRESQVGAYHRAGVKDIILEAALTTIQDCEDSVAAVDAEDKRRVYRNWLGLMQGTLEETIEKNDRQWTRSLNPDRHYTGVDGEALTLPGRSLMFVRNVGIHMYTDAVTTTDGEEIPEGFLDAMITCLCAKHDLLNNSKHANSRAGSIYIVKPKLHGPEEVAATVELFGWVEEALNLEPNTIKIGVMDEERRTTVNLKACIRAARERIVFINTGFLDRTGDEIHTMMEAGPTIPKVENKTSPWIVAYEDWNVDEGLATGLKGRAQIGKGMWPIPDAMAAMLEKKVVHPAAGANAAWVPSPTAATLHSTHYHTINVAGVQDSIANHRRARLADILSPPLLGDRQLSEKDIQTELDNNAQGILGYVVNWVDSGVGCSKVADIHNVGLMEDRATLRISSQHIANWLHHGIVTREQVLNTFKTMAVVVDEQNSGKAGYIEMAADFDNNIAFKAALELVFEGRSVTNGYTEPVLHRRRREAKAMRN